ncbi:MAG: stage 0 sporulation family protein [Xylanivirga thermophila]|jgi:cell fate regulator YaaT (PSP1 superfamily)|uniref:PSP1 domain-containing protein n=1 Tax=Xylanivirga thermophila TaxID=2496273 RepID=UPI00101DA86F|nr:stage 0 sporulation family protein [Xylanivirga thermophila]
MLKQLVAGVRFKKAGKIYYFAPNDIELCAGDHVIVETARGIEYGEVVVAPKYVSEDDIVSPLKNVIRKATQEDEDKVQDNLNKAKDAFDICIKKIEEHDLPMKLIDVEYTFDNNKIIFYFTAEGRVDFRELVRDLASIFRTRIELRQIGVRDEAKMVGGLGICGHNMCCCAFLGEFDPVSIKMAKEQGLSLNPAKISGVCGRLMCCLRYEQCTYEKARRKMPRVNAGVITSYGHGTVVETNVLLETAKVKVLLEDGTYEVLEFKVDDIEVLKNQAASEDIDIEIDEELDEEIKSLLDD